ncbi:WbqC family protein [Aureivirga sp. CE67]|uniref:WbqC family protein n=1 Tax=Aureivirga sp. CE67 TaxID=1788983 RepID=UPI0018C9E24C|nr:WbqC family protein [Aureivirga sp. CE67]
MKTIIHPSYFGSIAEYAVFAQSEKVIFENFDNYQKQTYRNRCYIYGANGKLNLNIPIKHIKTDGKKLTKDILIDNSFHWSKQHIKSLQSAYRTSPFFEFYEDDLIEVLEKKHDFLIDLNLETNAFIQDALQIEIPTEKTEEYMRTYEDSDILDFRHLVNAKKQPEFDFKTYVQVFDDKCGFIPNLSILDLLFMEGPNSISFLEEMKIK